MTPFWIVNFTKKDSCESFFETYWRAYRQNNPEAGEEDRFFYLTDATQGGLGEKDLVTTATRLTVDFGSEKKLIPCFTNKMQDLNVFFLGDVTDPITINHLHWWAAALRKGLLEKRWGSLTDIRFYALLWRPESATASPGVSAESKGFLNELATLEHLDINHRPFERVLFFQSSDAAEQKPLAMERMYLSTLFLARECRNVFVGTETRLFVDASATGLFCESQIQREHEAYKLGQILMTDLATSTDAAFFDRREAAEYVGKNGDYMRSLSPRAIAAAVKAGIAQNVDASQFDLPRPCHPLSFKVGRVWREYFGQYIVGMKKNLINSLRRELVRYEDDYRQKLYDNQYDYVKDRCQVLLNLVFAMFTTPVEDSKFQHVSLPQSKEVLARFREEIEKASREGLQAGDAFVYDESLQRAADRAAKNGWTAKHVLEVLSGRLRTLPVYGFARLARIVMLLLILGVGLFHLLTRAGVDGSDATWIGVGVAAVVWLIDIFVYTNKVRRIEALKQMYIATMLDELKKRLEVEIVNCEKKTYEEMLQYADWMRSERIERLQQSLSVLAPPAFNFRGSTVFQPLAGSVTDGEESARLIIPASKVSTEAMRSVAAGSGTFGKHPLIVGAPFNQMNANGEHIPLAEMVDAHKDSVQRLVKKLMGEPRRVEASTVREADFQRHEHHKSLHETMLLLLDVSGSMSGQSLDDLKHYVNSLSSQHEVDWIAFAGEVVTTSFENDDVTRLDANGGTSYLCAIEKAVEMMQNHLFDDIVLISDGEPFETLEELTQAATRLGQPLNTISIGEGGEQLLIDLAHATGGIEITVESLQQVKDKWNSEIRGSLVTYEGKEYTFGQLMKIVHIEGCAQALHAFALKQISSADLDIATALRDYGNAKGLEEWEEVSAQHNTHSQTTTAGNAMLYLSLSDLSDAASQYVEKRSASGVAVRLATTNGMGRGPQASTDEPDMVATLASLRPMAHIGDLLWADFTTNDRSLSATAGERLPQGAPKVNIYDEPIK